MCLYRNFITIMKKDLPFINNSVFLKVSMSNPSKVEIVDGLVVTKVVKDELLLPYLSSLYNSLTLRSDKPQLGVPRFALNEVLLFYHMIVVSFFTWANRGESLYPDRLR